MFNISIKVLEDSTHFRTYQDNLLSMIDCIQYINTFNNQDNVKILNVKIERLEDF